MGMNYSVRDKKSPALRAIEICWQNCLPQNRPNRQKYLQAFEILDLVREIEIFFKISSLLKPEEETLLRRTISQKPSLRLFKGECQSFLVGLVHFESIEEFLETRHHITRDKISRLVTDFESGYIGNTTVKYSRSYDASASSNIGPKYENYTSSYRHKDDPYSKDMDSKRHWLDPLDRHIKTETVPSSWPSKPELRLPDYNSSRYRERPKREENLIGQVRPRSFVSKLFTYTRNIFSGRGSDSPVYIDNLRDTYSYKQPLSESSKLNNISGSNPNERRLLDIKDSLADVRLHAQKLENNSGYASNQFVTKSIDELQAAVREQARIISRLERERERGFKTRGPRLISMLFVPWDYATAYVTVFVKDLYEELVPMETRSPPDFLLRLLSLFLGYFVVMYMLKVVYFVVVLLMLSSISPLSYILGYSGSSDVVPVSWLQFFPTLEYWMYQVRDWTGY